MAKGVRAITLGAVAAVAIACAGLPRWSVSADGKRLALWKKKSGVLFIVDRAGSLVKRLDLPEAYDDVRAAFLSPDAATVVCETEGPQDKTALVLLDVETGADRVVAAGCDKGYHVGDGWSPDGAHFAYVEADEHEYPLRVYERKSGRTRTLHRNTPANPCWARDGSAVYTIERTGEKGRGKLVRVPLAGVVERLADTAEWGWIQAGEDGSVWVASPERGEFKDDDLKHARLRRWDPKARSLEQISDEQIPWMQLSPDGKRLLAVTVRKGEKAEAASLLVLGLDGVTERTIREFKKDDEIDVLPMWLDAGTVMVAHEKGPATRVFLFDVASGKKTDWTAAYEALK
jgi:Tol biopolymer transport system component